MVVNPFAASMPFSYSKSLALLVQEKTALSEYMGIESVRSQEFSVAIFAFLVLAIILFAGITLAFMAGKKPKSLKTGEKWLFAWIFLGIVVSIIFGAMQLLGGYLF